MIARDCANKRLLLCAVFHELQNWMKQQTELAVDYSPIMGV